MYKCHFSVFYKKRISIADVIVLPVLGVGAFFTFSKEIILVAVAGLILVTLHFRIKQAIKMAIGLMIVICCVGYIFFTHFIVLNTNQKSKIIDLSRSEFSSGKIIYENENFVLLESSYMALKATSFNIGKEHCWLGIGSGNYTKKLLEEKQAGNYAANLPIYDPHSTYWGIFAENGVFVLVFLFAFVFILTNQLIKHKQAFPFYDASAILALLLICWVNAISCDILNYRHLWVLLGIASGIFASKEVSKNSQ